MHHTFINDDDEINGDYMAEAMQVANELEMRGYNVVSINDLGDGAEIIYGDIVM